MYTFSPARRRSLAILSRIFALLSLITLSLEHARAIESNSNANDESVSVASGPTLASRMQGAFFGALVADALSLGTHYEYDAKRIKQFYGVIDRYYAPGEKTNGQTHGVGWGARNYHNGNGNGPAKRAGEQTDYGDYNILILEHLASTADNPHALDISELIPTWQRAMRSWRSWICTQTRQTLQQVRQGTPYDQLGGYSNAMGIRYASAFSYFDSEQDIVDAARVSMFTHRETSAHHGNEFFARVTYRIIHHGLSPIKAIRKVAKESSSKFIKQKVRQALAKAKEAMDPDKPLSREEYVDDLALTSMARLWDVGKSEPIKVGKASPTEGTLPGAIYFIVKYAGNMVGAMEANAMVGGDSASRAVAIGMVMGAANGVEAIPAKYAAGRLVEWDRTQVLLNRLPLLASLNDATAVKDEL